jgi:thiosulfate/3-mercaptopyruvate sulfurtransferase
MFASLALQRMSIRWCACCGLLVASAAWAASATGADALYPRAELLIEPAELARTEVASKVVILDARDAKAFQQERIPGARHVDAAVWGRSLGDGQDAKGWEARIGALGISADSHVVVYDDGIIRDAARVWWILRYWGLENVRLLNGGLAAWKAESKALATGPAETPQPAKFEARPRADRLATKDELLASLQGQAAKLQIIDARSLQEFCGTDKLPNKRRGAIPGAVHLEWTEVLDPQTKKFKSPEQLKELFRQAGIDLAQPSTSHCQSGGRASVMVFALELMGAKGASNYHASWAEWGNTDDTPVEPGKPKDKQ